MGQALLRSRRVQTRGAELEQHMTAIRISAASPEADLLAAVQPGISAVYCSRVESSAQVAAADALITRLEQLRGIRPRHVLLRPLVETARGVSRAYDIATASQRCVSFRLGPHIVLEPRGGSAA